MIRSIRNAFITGVLVVLPLGITMIVINFLLNKIGTPASRFFFWYIDADLRTFPAINVLLKLAAVVVLLILITILGYSSRIFIGRWLLKSLERLLGRVPLINSIYRTVKQIVDTFSHQNKAVFQEVVLIEYPRPKCYAIGFLTSKARGEIQNRTDGSIVNIFVPTTPNPTSGFLLMLPESDITRLNMTVGDGMKLIISGGAVVPPETTEPLAPDEASEKSNLKDITT